MLVQSGTLQDIIWINQHINSLEFGKLINKSLLSHAFKHKNYEIFFWIVQKGIKPTEDTFESIYKNPSLDALTWVYNNYKDKLNMISLQIMKAMKHKVVETWFSEIEKTS